MTTTARNAIQNVLNVPRPMANWITDLLSAEQVEALSGSSVDAATVRTAAAGALRDFADELDR